MTRLCILFLLTGVAALSPARAEVTVLPFDVKLETVVKYDGPDWMWFHPRVAPIPASDTNASAGAVMIVQRHLVGDDFYSGMYAIRRDTLDAAWTEPVAIPELAWRDGPDNEIIAVCDVTPGWHAPTRSVIAIGIQLRYSKAGETLLDKPRSHQAAYSIYNPTARTWTPWKTIEVPDTETKFYTVAPGCVQWFVQEDGGILLPMYFRGQTPGPYVTTVLKCAFDGETIRYVEHGDELSLNVERGLCEPSLTHFNGTYYMTIRNDVKGYVTTSKDGLHFEPIKPWTFDDGSDLGSYNTQQHWLTHSDGLFLCYTRRGADNDFVFRNRAPLFMAQVDPEKLHVIRATEKILMPNRGATYGNFGATAINENESWVTDAEGMFGEARQRGADGSVFNARIVWSKPNRLASSVVTTATP